MKNKKQIIEIDRMATELTGKLVKLLKDNNLSARQDKVTEEAYHGLLFWRRTEFEEMKKEFKLSAADGRDPAQAPRGLKRKEVIMERIKEQKRRIKIVYLPCSFVVRVLQGLDSSEYFKVPVFEGLPEDIEVLRVMAFPERDAFGFTVRHPSFQETPEGNAFPELVLNEMIFRKEKVRRVE